MTIKIWTRGLSAEQQENDIAVIVAGADINPISSKILDTSETYSYDDDNLSGAQNGQLTGYFNSNGWTDVTP